MKRLNIPLIIGIILIPIIGIGMGIQGGLGEGMKGGSWERPDECEGKGTFIKCEGLIESVERNQIGSLTIRVRTKTGVRIVLSNERVMNVGETYTFKAQNERGMLIKGRDWKKVIAPLVICTEETDNSMNQIGSKSGYFTFREGMYQLVNQTGPKRISISQEKGVYEVVGIELVDGCH